MQLLPPTAHTGHHTSQDSGLTYAWRVDCRVVVDRMGRQAMHLNGEIVCGERVIPVRAAGLVDHRGPLIGREAELVRERIVATCHADAT